MALWDSSLSYGNEEPRRGVARYLQHTEEKAVQEIDAKHNLPGEGYTLAMQSQPMPGTQLYKLWRDKRRAVCCPLTKSEKSIALVVFFVLSFFFTYYIIYEGFVPAAMAAHGKCNSL
eukprot:6706594-Pyramimonas_sp.AAC.3